MRGRLLQTLGRTAPAAEEVRVMAVERVLGDGRVVVGGVAVPVSGRDRLRAGERVAVLVQQGRPVLVLSHRAQRVQGAALTPRGTGLIEALFVATDPTTGARDVWFRNDAVVGPLGLRRTLGADPEWVRWGTDGASFVVRTPVHQYHVFRLDRARGVPLRQLPRATRVRVDRPFTLGVTLTTLTYRTTVTGSVRSVEHVYQVGNPDTLQVRAGPVLPITGGQEFTVPVVLTEALLARFGDPPANPGVLVTDVQLDDALELIGVLLVAVDALPRAVPEPTGQELIWVGATCEGCGEGTLTFTCGEQTANIFWGTGPNAHEPRATPPFPPLYRDPLRGGVWRYPEVGSWPVVMNFRTGELLLNPFRPQATVAVRSEVHEVLNQRLTCVNAFFGETETIWYPSCAAGLLPSGSGAPCAPVEGFTRYDLDLGFLGRSGLVEATLSVVDTARLPFVAPEATWVEALVPDERLPPFERRPRTETVATCLGGCFSLYQGTVRWTREIGHDLVQRATYYTAGWYVPRPAAGFAADGSPVGLRRGWLWCVSVRVDRPNPPTAPATSQLGVFLVDLDSGAVTTLEPYAPAQPRGALDSSPYGTPLAGLTPRAHLLAATAHHLLYHVSRSATADGPVTDSLVAYGLDTGERRVLLTATFAPGAQRGAAIARALGRRFTGLRPDVFYWPEEGGGPGALLRAWDRRTGAITLDATAFERPPVDTALHAAGIDRLARLPRGVEPARGLALWEQQRPAESVPGPAYQLVNDRRVLGRLGAFQER